MKKSILVLSTGLALVAAGCKSSKPQAQVNEVVSSSSTGHLVRAVTDEPLHYPQEKHLKNVRQLTFGGNNAEAYWSFSGEKLIFQSDNKNWNVGCDQIFVMDTKEEADSTKKKQISTGLGRTTCSFFMPGDSTILYGSTHLKMKECPPVPIKESGKYVWPIYPEYDIFEADLNGNIVKQLTNTEGYDAEATVSPKGDKIIFTSMRNGDLDLYTMDIDGSNVKQVTNTLGYDGGATFSPDGKMIVWRASRPKNAEEIKTYRELLAQGLVEPDELEIFVANADGSNARQITHLGMANWSPYFHPSGKKVLFSSNHASPIGFPFNIFMINIDGTGLEQVTFDSQFDSFVMFSPNGKKVAFSSNRHNGRTRDTNVFIADWVD